MAPQITALSLSTSQHGENGTDVALSLGFSDVGQLDSHTVVIDWGAG
ncbi:MAG: hypothetical protein ACRD2W_19770 [Acidimicrobiales bacterium]